LLAMPRWLEGTSTFSARALLGWRQRRHSKIPSVRETTAVTGTGKARAACRRPSGYHMPSRGVPSVTICRTLAGSAAATWRAKQPPTLQPTRLTGVPCLSASSFTRSDSSRRTRLDEPLVAANRGPCTE
jgi:hypothetical protein